MKQKMSGVTKAFWIVFVIVVVFLLSVWMANAQEVGVREGVRKGECPGECTDADIARFEARLKHSHSYSAQEQDQKGKGFDREPEIEKALGHALGLGKGAKAKGRGKKQATMGATLKALVKASELQAGLGNVDEANEIVKQIDKVLKGMSEKDKEMVIFELIGMFK